VVAGVLIVTPAARLLRSWLSLLPLYLIHAGAGLSYVAERVGSRLARPALASGIAAVAVSVALSFSVLDVRERGAEQPPMSDNDIVGFLRTELGPRESALLDGDVAVASSYYFKRYSYTPPGLPPRRTPTTALVVIPRGGGPQTVVSTVTGVGWQLRPGTAPPRLVRRFEYVEAYRVAID
jgi:hypothetical protein